MKRYKGNGNLGTQRWAQRCARERMSTGNKTVQYRQRDTMSNTHRKHHETESNMTIIQSLTIIQSHHRGHSSHLLPLIDSAIS